MADEMKNAIKGNDHLDIQKVAEAGDAALAAAIIAASGPAAAIEVKDTDKRYTGENVETCLAEIAGANRTTETVKGNAANIATLSGLLGGFKIVSCSIENAADGAACVEITKAGVLATDVAIAIAADLSNSSATFLQSAVAGAGKVVVTFDGNTATGDKFNLLVIRPGA